MDARTPPPQLPDLPRTRSRNRKHPDPDRQVLHVEYSFANPDFSMHDSDSGSSAADTDDPTSSAVARRDERSMRRVVVMHDSRGRPAHIPMAQFYYDTVARSHDEDDEDDEDDFNGAAGDAGAGGAFGAENNNDLHNHHHHHHRNHNQRNSHGDEGGIQRLRGHNPTTAMPDRVAGSALNKPHVHGHMRARQHFHHRRQHAGHNGPQDEDRLDGSPDEAEVAPPPNRRSAPGAFTGSGQFGDANNNKSNIPDKDDESNQLMHIALPSSELRDVSTIEKDPGPNRIGRRASVIAGLKRAVSAVRLSEAATATSPPDSNAQGGKAGASEERGANSAAAPEPEHEPTVLEREREGTAAPPRRQTLNAVGRMSTLNRPRRTATPNPAGSPPTTPISPVSPESNSTLSPSSVGEASAAPAEPEPQQRARSSISGLGRFLSTNRRKSLATPVSSASTSDVTADGQRARSSPYSPDGNAQQASLDERRRPSSTRAGLNRIGRMISLQRAKPGATMQADFGRFSQSQPRQGASLVPDLRRAREARLLDDKPAAQLSPLSSSTLSLASAESPAGAGAGSDRDRVAAVRKRESSRLGIRGAGRLLSLSRRGESINASAAGGASATTTQGDDTAIRLRMSRRRNVGGASGSPAFQQGPRAQTMPPRGTGTADDVSPPRRPDVPRDKYTYQEVTSPAVLATGLLPGSPPRVRVPVIAMAEFSDPLSRRKWHIDAFTLPHNAVRKECVDLYDILVGLLRRGGITPSKAAAPTECASSGGADKADGAGSAKGPARGTHSGGGGGVDSGAKGGNGGDGGCARKEKTDVSEADLSKFEAWWDVACAFFRCYFEMERRVLLPWVDAAGPQDLEVQLALKKMRSMKDKLEQQLGKADRVWREKAFKTHGELLALVYKAVDDFAPRMLNYFLDQEVLLPAIVKQYYNVDKRMRLDKDMVAAFMENTTTAAGDQQHNAGLGGRRGKAVARHNLILLVRWMSDPKQLRAWIGQHLSASMRGLYSRWYALYESEHANLVRELRAAE